MKIDLIIISGGIIYGLLLITVVFVKRGILESFRIDALIMPKPSEKTRPINLFAGIAFAAYSIYSLFN
jgi:hypothetical protein